MSKMWGAQSPRPNLSFSLDFLVRNSAHKKVATVLQCYRSSPSLKMATNPSIHHPNQILSSLLHHFRVTFWFWGWSLTFPSFPTIPSYPQVLVHLLQQGELSSIDVLLKGQAIAWPSPVDVVFEWEKSYLIRLVCNAYQNTVVYMCIYILWSRCTLVYKLHLNAKLSICPGRTSTTEKEIHKISPRCLLPTQPHPKTKHIVIHTHT